VLRSRLPGRDLGRHAAGPEIQHLASDAQHLGKLVEQVRGRLAAAIFQVTQLGRRQWLAVAIFDQCRQLLLAEAELLAPLGDEFPDCLHRSASCSIMAAPFSFPLEILSSRELFRDLHGKEIRLPMFRGDYRQV